MNLELAYIASSKISASTLYTGKRNISWLVSSKFELFQEKFWQNHVKFGDKVALHYLAAEYLASYTSNLMVVFYIKILLINIVYCIR